MNRSVERIQLRTARASPGELAAGGFEHPERGIVESPATPLILADLRRRGLAATEGFLPLPAGSDRVSGVVFAVSYFGEGGDPTGFAAAADVAHVVGLRAAEEVVASWASVLRTRRIVVASGDIECSGSRRARQLADLGDSAGLPIYHPRTSTKRSAQQTGAERSRSAVARSPETAAQDGIAFYPAHGVPANVRKALEDLGSRVIDGTCPLVRTMEEDVRRFTARGDRVVLISCHRHAVTPTLTSHAPGSVVVVESEADVRALHLDPDRVSFVVGGGVVVEEAAALLAILRSKYPRLRGQHPNNMCYSASDEAETLRSMARAVDVVLVLGEEDEHTEKLMTQAVGYGAVARRMSAVGDLHREWIETAATVGIMSSASARHRLSAEVVEAIGGLGPLSVVRRSVTTDVGKTL